MRELKFRVWDKVKNRYLRHDSTGIDNLGNIIDFENCDEDDWGVHNVRVLGKNDMGFATEQYTGLHDKNGKKIFEGDVVESVFNVREAEVSAVGKICFFESLAAYGMKNVKYDNQELRRLCNKENEQAGEIFCFAGYGNTDEDQTLIFTDYCFIEDDLEVLGNIHENPELLERKK